MSNGTITLPATALPTLQAIGKLWQSLVDELQPQVKIKAPKIDPDQWWFWTPEWQAGEKQADEDIRLGHYETFNNAKDLIKSLHQIDKRKTK